MPDVAENLKRVPLFAELNGRQLKKLGAKFRERSFQPGTSVVKEGEMSGIGFFVITGRMQPVVLWCPAIASRIPLVRERTLARAD